MPPADDPALGPAAPPCEDGDTPRPIRHRYLLVIQIPVYRDAAGGRWTDPLWAKDLLRHLDYLADFALACPCFDGAPPPDSVRIDDARIRFVDLPARRKATLRLPVLALRLWREIGWAEVVHNGLGGWLPVSIGNLASLFALLRRRYLFINVESSPWRLVPGVPASVLQRARAFLAERINRRCLARADLAVFTQKQYRASLLPSTGPHQTTEILHASWIDASDVLSNETARHAWQCKQVAPERPLRLVFVGRLTAAKGVAVLLEALDLVAHRGRTVEVAVIGSGDLLESCRQAAARLDPAEVRLRVLEPVPYGPELFALIRDHHAVLVPSVTDEQPRIVYDAFAQAVPILGSATGGMLDCVEQDTTGRLCRPNDAVALADLLVWAVDHGADLERLGLAGLEVARRFTHQEMHRRRWALLARCLPPRAA